MGKSRLSANNTHPFLELAARQKKEKNNVKTKINLIICHKAITNKDYDGGCVKSKEATKNWVWSMENLESNNVDNKINNLHKEFSCVSLSDINLSVCNIIQLKFYYIMTHFLYNYCYKRNCSKIGYSYLWSDVIRFINVWNYDGDFLRFLYFYYLKTRFLSFYYVIR